MKHLYLLSLFALIAPTDAYAASGLKEETALVELSDARKFELFLKAANAFEENQPRDFMKIINEYPEIMHFIPESEDVDLLGLIIFEISSRTDKTFDFFYPKELLKKGVEMREQHIMTPLKFVYASICMSQGEVFYQPRLCALAKIFHLYEQAQLHPDAQTAGIKTPQQLMQAKGIDFLESQECLRCKKPWKDHPPVIQSRFEDLRRVLQLN